MSVSPTELCAPPMSHRGCFIPPPAQPLHTAGPQHMCVEGTSVSSCKQSTVPHESNLLEAGGGSVSLPNFSLCRNSHSPWLMKCALSEMAACLSRLMLGLLSGFVRKMQIQVRAALPHPPLHLVKRSPAEGFTGSLHSPRKTYNTFHLTEDPPSPVRGDLLLSNAHRLAPCEAGKGEGKALPQDASSRVLPLEGGIIN